MTIRGLINRFRWILLNHVYVGTKKFEQKRKLMCQLGYKIGEGTKIVGPIFCTGQLIVGENCWIGKNFTVNGNGIVVIGDACDIAPEVTFQTGSHEIGNVHRRAGEGYNADITVGDGCWIGVRSTILGGVRIGKGSVIAACACVTKDVARNTLVGGVPATKLKELPYD